MHHLIRMAREPYANGDPKVTSAAAIREGDGAHAILNADGCNLRVLAWPQYLLRLFLHALLAVLAVHKSGFLPDDYLARNISMPLSTAPCLAWIARTAQPRLAPVSSQDRVEG